MFYAVIFLLCFVLDGSFVVLIVECLGVSMKSFMAKIYFCTWPRCVVVMCGGTDAGGAEGDGG